MLTISKHQSNMPNNLMSLLISVSILVSIWKSLFKLILQHGHFLYNIYTHKLLIKAYRKNIYKVSPHSHFNEKNNLCKST